VYEALSVEFPNVILVAHTDDLLKTVLPPGDGEDWGTKVTELHKCNGRYDELANPIGIYRNLEKCNGGSPVSRRTLTRDI
jgi:hypothetical protein